MAREREREGGAAMAACVAIQFADYFVMIIITVCAHGKWITFNMAQLKTPTSEAKVMT